MRALALFLILFSPSIAAAQPAGVAFGDFSKTVTGVPSIVIPSALPSGTRGGIFLQVQGAAAVACRADGTPGFAGGSIVLKGDAGTPAAGGSAMLTGALADPRAWSCVAYPVGGAATVTLTVKVYP